ESTSGLHSERYPLSPAICGITAQMAGSWEWLANNWFSLIQGLGIICGLLFTAFSIRRDTAARRASDLLSLSERHQELWAELYRSPELRRIRNREVDLLAEPVTAAEEEFLKLVFVHFHVGWLVAQRGALVPMEAVKKDV